MKTIKYLLFFAVTLFFKSSFSQTANVKEGCTPLEVTFTAPAGSSTYYWDFKDGVTSDKQKPTTIFNKAGVYNVTFQEKLNGPVIGTVQIKVYKKPVLSVSIPAGCAPLNAEMEGKVDIDPAVVINNYVWVYGDGLSSSGSGEIKTNHMYSNVGLYDISFSIETNSPTCNITEIFKKAVEVVSPPVVSFSTNPATLITCKDTLDVTFINNSSGAKPLSYLWDFGNGKTSVLQTPPQQRYISAVKGLYTASLLVSYTGIKNCSVSSLKQIGVGKPVLNIKAKKDTVCINIPTVVKTITPGTYLWNVGPNGVATNLTKDSVIVTFNKAGVQTVTLTVTSPDGKCFDTKSVKIYVDEVTAKIESPDPTFSCDNPKLVHLTGVTNQPTVEFNWNFSDTKEIYTTASVNRLYISGSDSIYYDKNRKEDFNATLTVISTKTGCSATATRKDTLWVPNALTLPSITKGCAPLNITFSDSSSSFNKLVKWEWLFGDGAPLTKADKTPVNHTYNNPGEYNARLVVTSQMGCVDTSYAIKIEVGNKLNSSIDFSVDKNSVCPGDEVKFTSNISPATKALIDAYHFSSEGNRVSHCFDEDKVTWAYNDLVGPQNVSLTVDYNGCYTTLTKPNLVDVKGAIAKIDYTALCSAPYVYTFQDNSVNALSRTWKFGDNETSTNSKEVHTYAATGNYTVELEVTSAGCPSSRAQATIHVTDVKAKIKMDTLLCINKPYALDAMSSKNVDGSSCKAGYTWEFPTMDKRPLTTANPVSSFNFGVSGNHTVRLITKDVNGCKDTTTKQFKIYDLKVDLQKLRSDLTDVTSICNPNTVLFKDKTIADTTMTSWFWSFGDNKTSTLQNTSHEYLTAPTSGNYYIGYLTVEDALGCSETSYFSIKHYAPTSTISANPGLSLCLGTPVTLSASDFTQEGSKLEYKWDFGLNDGQISTLQSNPVTYPASGDYTVKLTFTESSSGCEGSASTVVHVQDYPKVKMTTEQDTLKVLCGPANIFFRDSSTSTSPIVSYTYDFGNGKYSFIKNPDLFFEKGTYNVKLTVKTSFGCADDTVRTFKVLQPEGTFEMDKNIICKGEVIKFTLKDTADVSSYTWNFGDGNTVSDQAPVTHQYNFHPPSGNTNVKLLLRQGSCPNTIEKPLSVYQVIAAFDRGEDGDTSICFSKLPYSFTNTSTGNDIYMWNFGDGTTSTELNPSHNYATPGVYNVTLSVANNNLGCTDTLIQKAVIYDLPKVIAMSDTVCQGKTLHPFVVNPVASSAYLWSPETGLSDKTVTNPKVDIEHSIIYTVQETDTNSCVGTTDVAAIVIEPIGLADWDTSIVIGDKVALPVFGQPVYVFKWTPELGLSCLDCNYPIVSPLEDITYKLEVSDIKGCFYDSYLFNVTVKPETFIRIPTSFTPNDDTYNDVVYVKGWGIKELVEFQIFNRWGQLVFTTTDINKGWDGKFNGVLQNSDSYAYKVKARSFRNEDLYDEGFINLLH